MKSIIRILTMTIAALVLSLPNAMAEDSAILTSADLEVLTEVEVENAVILEDWMIKFS